MLFEVLMYLLLIFLKCLKHNHFTYETDPHVCDSFIICCE